MQISKPNLNRAVLLLTASLLLSCALPKTNANANASAQTQSLSAGVSQQSSINYLPEGVKPVRFGQAKIKLAGQVYTLEFAANDQQRSRGLMYRRTLCQTCGMLFDFGETRYVGMWMKNTNVALDVAYVDTAGKIINIEQMQPHTLQAHHSDTAVRYAIEMNLGWFARQQITPGDRVKFISAMPIN